MVKKKKTKSNVSLKLKLRFFAFAILLPMGLLSCLQLYIFEGYNMQHNLIARNVTVASEFNVDFKKTLDYKMYRYIIGGYKNFEEYAPFADINQARGVVERLQESTERADSLTRLKYITNFLDKLEKSIRDSRNIVSYEESMKNLENNIRGLSELISDEMHNYIYYETQELAELQQHINKEIQKTLGVTGIIIVSLIIVLWSAALIISNSITKPIEEMIQNIHMVGEGDFTVRPIASSNDEIQTLSHSFDVMVERIAELVEDVKNKQENQRQIELQLLQAQINPHFLYNTFDTIIWFAEDNKNNQVMEITTSLSNYFRTTLSQGRDFIFLQEEELHVRSYLEIQKVRYRDILMYEIYIPEDLYKLTIPKMTLQPLVENALYHGIKHKRSKGSIIIKAKRQGDCIILEVCDDGAGITPEKLSRLNDGALATEDNQSFGCANVHERIQLYYGEPYGLHLESELGKGTTAIVTLPAKNNIPLSKKNPYS